jgi:glycosyltransferase involved in cell wall biosynthesis
MSPTVSVIIRNYNHAPYLKERIDSVLNQTYQDFEVIILDDCSPDNSVEVIEQYRSNPHVSHILINEQNTRNTFIQWERGISMAKGRYIWIAESDDSCDKSLLETLVSGYVDNHAVLAFCRSFIYDIHGNKSIFPQQMVFPWDIVMQGKSFISKYLINSNSVANASSVIFNRNVAMTIDKQYMTMRSAGDWLFWIELMEQGNVYFCTKELNYFRLHDMNTTPKMYREGVTSIEHKKIFDYQVSRGYIKKEEVKYAKLRFIYSYMTLDYSSRSSRRSVFMVWDRFYLGRIHIILSKIREEVRIFLRNI